MVVKNVPDLGNQHNNSPHEDQIFDNSSALRLVLWAKIGFGLEGGGGGGGGGMMHPTRSTSRQSMTDISH